MILVFEGTVGSGKSTLATAVSAITKIPVYRPFRMPVDGHAPGELSAPWAAEIGFPINTWMEDLFQADLHAALKTSVLLDRSMPSALVYEWMGITTSPSPLDTARARRLALEAWSARMHQAGARIVLMKASIATCVRRRRKQGAPTHKLHVEKEQHQIQYHCARTGLPILSIDTTHKEVTWVYPNGVEGEGKGAAAALKAVKTFTNPCHGCANISGRHQGCVAR